MLFYLNGTSSSGKTSIAMKLQKLLPEPCFYFSIDTLLYSLAPEDLEAIMGKRPYRKKISWDNIFEGYFASVAALAKTGNNLIADCPVYTKGLASAFQKYIQPIETKLVVKIECPLLILEDRERHRGDKATGIAKRQFESIHSFLEYDLEYESDKQSPEEIATAVFSALD